MPSGDSSTGAVFCAIVAIEMGMPWIYIIMPFVMLGRVYYQCHWIGDTIVGFFVGTFWGIFGATYFTTLVPLFEYATGEDGFMPLS